MEAAGTIAVMLAGWLCSGMLPLVLCVIACIDIARNGRPWWWFGIVIGMPVLGPLFYFVASRSMGGSTDSRGTPRDRRRQAESRLRDLQVQLAHWRGPAVLAEAGEELLALGRFAEAEAHFREAKDRGAPPQDANLGLAEALVAGRRVAEAVPLLQELLAAEPDHAMGRAQLLLARCLDDLDRGPEAEAALRKVLERRNPAEARARLARRLVLRGAQAEGRALANEVVAEAQALSPAMRRTQAPWTKLAQGVAAGRTALPRLDLRDAGERRSRWPWIVGAAIAVLLLLLGALGIYAIVIVRDAVGEVHEVAGLRAAQQLRALQASSPWTRGDDPGAVVLEPADVTAYVSVRRAMIDVSRRPTPSPPAPPAPSGLRARFRHAIEESGLAAEDMADPGLQQGEALIDACDAAHLDPAALPVLVQAIEWRFLHRDEARIAALPEPIRQDAFDIMRWLAEGDPEAGDEDAWRAEQAEKLAALTRLAPADDALAPATRALLEERRAELEALDAAAIPQFCLAAAEVAWLKELDLKP